jgi:predicted component of type VI protein secretion system
MARLQLADGRSVQVEDGLVLGRVSGCGIVLDDDKVSRKHARLIVQVGVVEVEDLGSRNGVHINGTRVLRRVLRDGDVLLIGRTEIRFVGAVAAEASAPDLAGVDLLADEDEAPVIEPSARAQEPVEDLELEFEDEPVAPVPKPAVPPPPPRAPEPAPAEEVEVLEFVDEVVEVRKPVRPAPAQAAASQGAARALPDRDRGVLQFHKNLHARGGIGEDVGQLGGFRKAMVVALGIVAAAAAAYGAYVLAG